MALLVLLLIHMYANQGQSAEQEIVHGIGIKLCNLKCSQRGSCVSFAYDTDRLACYLSHQDASHWTMQGFAIFPKTKNGFSAGACSLKSCERSTRCVEKRRGGAVCVGGDTVSSALYKRCSANPDCPVERKFVCFTETCKCTPGFSFNPAKNSCVRRCESYGAGFTTYRGLSIRYHNDKVITSKSAKECCEICLAEKTFTCLTFDYHIAGNKCQLSKSGYLDVPPHKRVSGLIDWNIVVRNCE